MARENSQAPASSDNSPAAFTGKKRRNDQSSRPIEESKKGKKLTPSSLEPETLTPQRTLSYSSLNQFDTLSSRKRKKKKKKKKEKSCGSGIDYRREWTYSPRDFSRYTDRIVVVSYNILGVDNASKHPDLYCKVTPKFLEWKRRKRLICKEVNHYNASILCFQEVDQFGDLSVRLKKHSFEGIYKARTGDAHDGLAIFWKSERFTLVHQENIEFKTFGLRDSVAQLCVLKMNQIQVQSCLPTESFMSELVCSETSNEFGARHGSKLKKNRFVLVGNIHVLFNPKRGDVKLGQVRLFLDKAHQLSEDWGGIPIIFGGDLNSVPQSAIYQFVASSELDVKLHDRRKMSGQFEGLLRCMDWSTRGRNIFSAQRMPFFRQYEERWSDDELRLATGSEGTTFLRHKMKLFSAYSGIPGLNGTRGDHGEPLVTSYHSQFMGTVDYIWHTGELIPVKVLETLPINILRRMGGLPSEKWGSDHLALVCELAFTDG